MASRFPWLLPNLLLAVLRSSCCCCAGLHEMCGKGWYMLVGGVVVSELEQVLQINAWAATQV
jgi:hypothetical protein